MMELASALLRQYSSTAVAAVAGLLVLYLGYAVALPRILVFLGPSQQLRVERFTARSVHNGPGVVLLNPFGYRSARVVEAESLSTLSYLVLKDAVSGKVRVERGPQQFFLGAYDVVEQSSTARTLGKTDYIFVTDLLTGNTTTVRGPRVWFPEPHQEASETKAAISLKEDEFLRLIDESSGNRWIVKGKDLVFLESTWRVDKAGRAKHSNRGGSEAGDSEKAYTLKAHEYVRLLDGVTGKVVVHKGEQIVFPGPNESLVDGTKMDALELKANEYVKIIDQGSGQIRVVAGTSLVFLGPNEKFLEAKQRAIEVDAEHAALVRDMRTGQLRLITEQQLFVPGPDETIEEVRELIKLADHEAMIIKDYDGQLRFHYGDTQIQSGDRNPRAFFLPPHAEVVKLWWSGGLRRTKRDLCIERFDCRPNFMWNEIDCRTQDNVELMLETTQFWEVQDLPKLVRTTGNLPGDIYNQIRSQFIKHVAGVTLKEFMQQLHRISKAIFEEDTGFYEARGVKIHSLEVTKFTCSERRTSEVLQQIIEETTNRLNRLSQAESENEVKLFKMQGQIEHERLNSELLSIQHAHAKAQAAVAGTSEAERIASFVQRLEQDVPSLEDRIRMWEVLRKTDALSVLAAGGASLYYTPNDVDLSIKTARRD